jgi:hypothetical protein
MAAADFICTLDGTVNSNHPKHNTAAPTTCLGEDNSATQWRLRNSSTLQLKCAADVTHDSNNVHTQHVAQKLALGQTTMSS